MTEDHHAPDQAPPRARLDDGLRLAATTFTVAPVRAGVIDRGTAKIAMAVAPYLGLALGALVGLAVVGLNEVVDSPFVTSLIAIGLLAALTRGLHLDGLADTTDALGAYRDRDRALEIMKRPDIGPFGVVAIVLAVVIPAACISTLSLVSTWKIVITLATACGAGRLAAALACRRGVPAARPDGLGALVADNLGWLELAYGAVAVAAASIFVVPNRAWQGPVVVAVALGATVALVAHLKRRLGGITGDVLGACIEIATTLCLVGFLVRSPY